MKKTLKKLIVSSLCCLGLLQNGVAQTAVAIIIGESARQANGDCGGSGRGCANSIVPMNFNNPESVENTGNLFLTENQRLNLRFSKNTMSATIKEWNFEQKLVYFIEKDTPLDLSLCAALQKESIVIKQGMYPIIEWEDAYFVSFQIEEK